jgi:hypothetical protein
MDKQIPQPGPMIQDTPIRFLGLIMMSLLLYGCVLMDKEESVQGSGMAALQSDNEAEQNLAAIRALFPQREKPTVPVSESRERRSSESDVPPWPPDWLSAYLSPPQSSDQGADLSSVYAPSSPSSLSKPRVVSPDTTVKIPQVITPHPRSSETALPLPVPAYTVPAPIGSAYPGSSRCVPDLLGGQRCHTN